MPKLKINDVEIEVAPGTSILQAAEMLGYEIPRFCYHDKLSVPANCRMCLVEVKGAPKPVASCAMACGDNMEVFTESSMTQKARKGVMEMLLINHPLDCPICDQGGECDLQDQAMAYGFDRTRYYESKRAVPDKDLGPLVKTSMNRCIQCTRCVRFCDEIAGTGELGLMNRGENVEIGPFVNRPLETEMAGNLIDVCPVGALTSKPYAFIARPWELRKTETIDVHDAVGSNIRVDSRGREVMRVLPRLNEDVNEEWISDCTRFAVDGLKYQRLDRPYVRDAATGRLRPAAWDEALAVVADRMGKTAPDKMAAIAGDLCAIEEMVALKDLMMSLGARNFECRVDGAAIDPTSRAGYLFNTTIAGIEQADAVLLIGCNPRREATLVNARLRKTWLNNNKRLPIAVIGEAADLTYAYDHLGTGPEAMETLLAGKGDFASVLKSAKNPVVIVGMGALRRVDGRSVLKLCHDLAVKYQLAREGWNGFNLLHTAAARVGALDIGFATPFNLPAMEFVYLLNADGPILGQIDLRAFVVYQGHHGDAGAARADVILPGCAYTEKNGLYVNLEGRVQQARQAVNPPGDSQEDWMILGTLADAAARPLTYHTPADLRARIVQEWPQFAQVGEVHAAADFAPFGHAGTIAGTGFVNAVQGYYQTNVIANASPTMASCARLYDGAPAPDQKTEAAA